ncbi:DUF5344 family protein [Ruminococcus albus]|uniref:Uncharacterized protein n=1 Tax=Ruminococcus albus TaxID=1264 RepID=A0A1H7LUN4_RUMAL|nr:DUF5344 family protein [Ruminococcus albus]SEL02671.1 hypothetical protein SAMN05216469_11014 [Ruminococcus albus]
MAEIKLDQATMLENISALQFSVGEITISNFLDSGVGEGSPAMERFVELYYAFSELLVQYRMKLNDDLRFVNESLNLMVEQESEFAQYFDDNPAGTSPLGEISGVSLDFGG